MSENALTQKLGPLSDGKPASTRESGLVAFDSGSPSANNFDSLRFVFAVGVAAYHFAVLTAAAPLAPAVPALAVLAELGVAGFFIVSGHLVYASCERSSLPVFVQKRVRRLYPAYATVILLSASAALLVSPAARADLAGVGRYLAANLVFLNFLAPKLPGLFAHNPMTEVNGALWTLKIEVLFYCLLPLLALLIKATGKAAWLAFGLIYALSEAWRIVLGAAPGGLSILAHQLPGQMSYFVMGMALWRYRDSLKLGWPHAVLGAALTAASFLTPGLEFVRAAGLAMLVLWLAIGVRIPVNFARFGDLSYGIYIVHFPIIQGLVAARTGAPNLPLEAGLAVLLIVSAALLMWRFVERPFLRRDSHYRAGRLRPKAAMR